MKPNRPFSLTQKIIDLLRRHGIFTRLLLVFCILLVSSTLIITFFNQQYYTHEIENKTGQYLFMLVKSASLKLRQEASRFEDSMTLFSVNEDVLRAIQTADSMPQGNQSAASSYVEQTLLSIKDRMDGIKAILFVTSKNQYRMAMNHDSIRGAYIRNMNDFWQSDLYTQTIKANGYPVWLDSTQTTSNLFYENENDSLGIIGCVTLSSVVYDPVTRKPLGVLIYCIYPDFFSKVLSEYAGKDGGNTYVVGNKGMIEAINPSFAGPPMMYQPVAFLSRVFSENEGSLSLFSDNRNLIASHCTVDHLPLAVVDLTYQDYILRTAKQIQRNNMMVLFAVIAVGIVCFYFAAVSIEYPVKKLIHTMKQVGSGDFSAVYHSKSNDEIGVLCKEFDRMVDDMKSLIDRVYIADINEKALQLNEKNAQLDALQMQINPHFLYNTLDMIRWQCMADADGESAASDMIEKFCTLLRMTIKGEQKYETVSDSLLHASTYLEVVNFRHRNKIQLLTNIDFDTMSYQLPRLALQPILENAVRHGFASDKQQSNCVCICGELTIDGCLILRVSDNGSGMTEEQLAKLQEGLDEESLNNGSIGLRNVNQRCKLYYGESYGIQIESELDRGTVVILKIPAQSAPSKEECHV